jgi:araC-type DNA-binding domain-containing proteins
MEPIRVEQLAKYSHLSETHFRRVFTEYMHMGPLEYINTVRIRTACEHLKKTEEPVADIAHKCGFTTNSTFNRNFKQMMGVTPVEWRKRPENYEQRLLNYEIHTEKGW